MGSGKLTLLFWWQSWGDLENIWFHILWSACNFRCLDVFLVFWSKWHFHFGVMWICVEGISSVVRINLHSGRGVACVLQLGTQRGIRRERYRVLEDSVLWFHFHLRKTSSQAPRFFSLYFSCCESKSCLCCWCGTEAYLLVCCVIEGLKEKETCNLNCPFFWDSLADQRTPLLA